MIVSALTSVLLTIGSYGCPSPEPSYGREAYAYERPIDGSPPGGDGLGDAWEMVEISCWQGTWLRRGSSNIFDAYWTNPNGERVRATLRMRLRGRTVTVERRHDQSRHCLYEGRFSRDWREVAGHYSCTWERTPMPWRARIVRLRESSPVLVRDLHDPDLQPGDR